MEHFQANTRTAICTCYFLSIAAFASTFFPATNNTCSWGNPCKMPMIPTSRDKRGSLDGACLNSCLDTAPVHPNCQLSFSSSALHITSYCQHTQIKFPWSMDGFCQICRTHQLDRDPLKCMSQFLLSTQTDKYHSLLASQPGILAISLVLLSPHPKLSCTFHQSISWYTWI